jgi:hypothetical protein
LKDDHNAFLVRRWDPTANDPSVLDLLLAFHLEFPFQEFQGPAPGLIIHFTEHGFNVLNHGFSLVSIPFLGKKMTSTRPCLVGPNQLAKYYKNLNNRLPYKKQFRFFDERPRVHV